MIQNANPTSIVVTEKKLHSLAYKGLFKSEQVAPPDFRQCFLSTLHPILK